MIGVSAIASLVFFLIFIFLQGGALGLIRDFIKTDSIVFPQFTEYGKKFYVKILLLLLLYFAIALGVVLILALISAGLLYLGDNVAVRSVIAVIITVVSVMVITALIYPIYAVVTEDMGPVQALKRGITVAKSNFLGTLGLFLLLLLISLLISLLIGFIAGVVTIPLGDTVSRIVLSLVNAVVQSYIPVVMMIAFMRFYMGLIAKSGAEGVKGPVVM
jgi:hypothetical protein